MKTSLAAALVLALVLGLWSTACDSEKPGTCSTPQSPHRASCSDPCCGDGNNPPTGGGHCPNWLPCRVYSQEQLRCQWLHNVEHGHLVLLYNCPEGCPEIVSALEAIWQSRPTAANGAKRALLTPDSQLPGKVAAVVFGHSWVGDTVDQAAIDEVISHEDAPGVPEPGLACAP